MRLIKRIFFLLDQPLICFSRSIAARTSSVVSKNTSVDTVPRSKPGHEFVLVLEDTAFEIIRDSDVHSPGPVRHDVDEKGPRHSVNLLFRRPPDPSPPAGGSG